MFEKVKRFKAKHKAQTSVNYHLYSKSWLKVNDENFI